MSKIMRPIWAVGLALALSASSMTAFAADAPAKRGAASEQVKQAQTELNKSGLSLTVDGKMGPKTRAAIMKFQSTHGLKATGTLDAATKTALHIA